MMEISFSRCHLETQGLFFSNISRTIGWEDTPKLPYNVAAQSSRWAFHKVSSSYQAFNAVYPRRPFFCKTHSMSASLEESASLQSGDNSSEDEDPSTDLEEETLPKPLTSEQIMTLLADTEREKLTKKLSEANMQNRFLKRQLHVKEEALVKFKSELAVMELEVQALAKIAEEIAQSGVPEGARKINGKYIHSHLVTRLEGIWFSPEYSTWLDPSLHKFSSGQVYVDFRVLVLCPYWCKRNYLAYKAVHEQLKEQIKDVDAAQSKEVCVSWVGMAESVQVMGTFDGWSQGEHLSPEYTGSYTRFSTTLMLRPGRYEIKFLVDGEWQVSPEFPITGEGLTNNNLLIVE